jgi:hypothetical protein
MGVEVVEADRVSESGWVTTGRTQIRISDPTKAFQPEAAVSGPIHERSRPPTSVAASARTPAAQLCFRPRGDLGS